MANDLFIEFDTATRAPSATEVLEIVKLGSRATSLVDEVAFDADRHAVDLDTSSWRLTAETKDGLRAELLVLPWGGSPRGSRSRALAGPTV